MKLPRKSIVKEASLRILLVIVLTALLIFPQRTIVTFAQTGYEQYFLTAYPTYIQEEFGTNITVNILQGQPNLNYSLILHVYAPDDAYYYTSVIVETDALGTGSNYTKFWSDFANATAIANTNLVGMYDITLYDNAGNAVAYSYFTVGLTDKLEYLRSENVKIHGSGYNAEETVLVDLKFDNESISGFPRNVNASAGVVTYSWTIPQNASIGVYTVTLTNSTTLGTRKRVADVQSFKVGVNCEVQTINLASQPVANVTVEAYNSTSGDSLDISQRTNQTGWARFLLWASNCTFKAFWKDVEVGTINKTVIDDIAFSFAVELSNIKLTVKDETSALLPFIDLSLKYNYTNKLNKSLSETESFYTNLAGYVQIPNVFTNISYLIEARRYGLLFNTTSIKSLPALPWNEISIIAPTYTMFVQVLDSKDVPSVGLKVAAYDWSSGIGGEPLQQAQTNSDGNVTFSLTVGRYRLRLYAGTTFLNEVTVNLQNQSSLTIQCDVYNVDLNVLVVDFLGQPIPNVSVEFQRKNDSNYQTTQTKTTGSNGVALFNNIIGGDSRIYVSVAGGPSEIQYLYLVGPTKNVVFKMDGYVAIAGYVLETSQFVTVVVLLIIIVAFIVALTYKRLPRLLQRRRK